MRVPDSILSRWEREQLEDIAHARAMIAAYRAAGDDTAAAWWAAALERLERVPEKRDYLKSATEKTA